MFRRRMEKVIRLAETHCGHSENVQELVCADLDFEDWFMATVKSERKRWYQEGHEDGKKGLVNEP